MLLLLLLLRQGGVGERLLGCVRIHDNDMALLEVVHESVQVGQVEPAACIIAALQRRSMEGQLR